MTNEEAKRVLSILRDVNRGWFSDEISKALDVAIEVLGKKDEQN